MAIGNRLPNRYREYKHEELLFNLTILRDLTRPRILMTLIMVLVTQESQTDREETIPTPTITILTTMRTTFKAIWPTLSKLLRSPLINPRKTVPRYKNPIALMVPNHGNYGPSWCNAA